MLYYNKTNIIDMLGAWVDRSDKKSAFAGIEKLNFGYGLKRYSINGTWAEGRLWRKAPDGRIFVNLGKFERWVESQALNHTL